MGLARRAAGADRHFDRAARGRTRPANTCAFSPSFRAWSCARNFARVWNRRRTPNAIFQALQTNSIPAHSYLPPPHETAPPPARPRGRCRPAARTADELFQKRPAKPTDLAHDKNLYVVGYAHLDTQWRWIYPETVRDFIRNTMESNFALFEKYPNYVFNFTGSRRYEFMKEYYPEEYARVKQYVAAGQWFPAGSSVDEGDANVPSLESMARHFLYGNHFFQREFGKHSDEFMLPDCFGFPASLPTILAHGGIKGFSTAKADLGQRGRHPLQCRHVDRAGRLVRARRVESRAATAPRSTRT